MEKETTEDALRRISRNIARLGEPGYTPYTVVEEIAPGCGHTVRIVYPPGWEREPTENPSQDPKEEQDDRSDGASHNID